MTPEDWRNVIDYWVSAGHDIKYMDVPPEVAKQLGIEIPPLEPIIEDEEENDDMTETAQHEPAGLKWKKKKHFDGSACGLKACTRTPDGYLCDTKPTKDNNNGRLWFGPACNKCIQKDNPNMRAMTLAELAFQRNGASDLALVLDIEVGELMGRLQEEGIDEKGSPLIRTQEAPLMPQQALPHTESPQQTALAQASPGTGLKVVTEDIPIPLHNIQNVVQEAQGVLVQLGNFHVVNQQTMDMASALLAETKGKWNNLDELRKSIGAPLRAKLEEVNGHFRSTLDMLKQVEGIFKQKIAEGSARALEAQQEALLAAQAAHQAGDTQAMGLATQAAAAADVTLPQGIRMRPIVRFEIVDASQLPGNYWSPDLNKIQQAINQGNYNIPGVRCWEEQSVSSRAS